MKKRTKLFSLVLALILALSTLAILPASAKDFADTLTTDSTAYAIQPAGSGTEADPYLISNVAEFIWFRQMIPAADLSAYKAGGAHYANKEEVGAIYGGFEGKFIKQTADIDLGGASLPSLAYYANIGDDVWSDPTGSDRRFGAFAGTYDGNGYSIKNGTISSKSTSQNLNWGHGLFGFIYGATIKNLTLENITVASNNISGVLAGHAFYKNDATGHDAEINARGNKILNCHLIGCTLNVEKRSTAMPYVTAGGLIGVAFNTTIQNCTVDTTINAPCNYRWIGGIAGVAGANTVIDHCVYTGTINLDATAKASDESAYGGIVGYIAPNNYGADYNTFAITQMGGTLKITNCYNSGSVLLSGTESSGKTLIWGGILGGYHASTTELMDHTVDAHPFLVENCYNLYNPTSWTTADNTDLIYVTYQRFTRVKGIIGSGWCAKNAVTEPMNIKDCTTVNFTSKGYQTSIPEYGSQTNNPTSSGAYLINAVSGVPNVVDRTAEAIGVETAKIDAVINTAKAAVAHTVTAITASKEPVGDGTANAPYIVESAANLVWLREQVDAGNEQEGKYFLQIADINLEGGALAPIGGPSAHAFKGIYDGKGYAITNGYIQGIQNHNLNTQTNTDSYYATGLFGHVANATVRGVVLDNVVVEGYGITGAIVGCNLTGNVAIEDCRVEDTCRVYVGIPTGDDGNGITLPEKNFSNFAAAGVIAGKLIGATVKNCVAAADLTAQAGILNVGGVVGNAGSGTTVDTCVHSGALVLVGNLISEHSYGGIVGFIGNGAGGLSVKNCYNSGVADMSVVSVSANGVYWGGIVGGTNSLTGGQTYLIDGCYNTAQMKNNGNVNFRVGGLVGSTWLSGTAANNNNSPLCIKDSYTVALTIGTNKSAYYGNDAYRYFGGRTTKDGKYGVMIWDGTAYVSPVNSGTSEGYPANATVGTKTASEMADAIAAVDTAITSAQTAAYHGSALISYKGYQSTVPADGKVDLRLVFGIDIPENELGYYSRIHVYAIGSSGYESLETTKVYTSIQGTKADNSPVTYTASELGTEYLAALKVAGVPTTGTYTLKLVGIISSHTIGDSYEVSTITVTITNGAA